LKFVRKFLRHVLVWWLPGLAMLVALAAGFIFWLVASQNGTRLLLTTAAQQLEGQALDVNGSLLHGVTVGRLELTAGGTHVDIHDLDLSVRWSALGDRLLHVRNLSAGSVRVDMESSPETPPAEERANPSRCPSCR